MGDRVRELLGDEVVEHDGMHLERHDRSFGGRITVTFPAGRKQVVRYRFHDGRIALTSTCIGKAFVESPPPGTTKAAHQAHLARELLTRNRHTELVGFRFKPRGAVEAFVDHPASTLTREELLFTIVHLAQEADRMEWVWTARDVL
jgi:hypothetical protein